jgi:hypothetical protein
MCFNNPIVFIFLVVSCHVPRRKPLAPLNPPKSQLKPLLPYNLYKLLKRVLEPQYHPNLQKPRVVSFSEMSFSQILIWHRF